MIEPSQKEKSASEAMPVTSKNLRVFGVGVFVILNVIWALRFFVFHHGNTWLLLAVAAFFLVTGLFLHPVLKPIYQGWTWIAHKIGWFNTRLLLGMIFYLMFTPIAILAKILGKDFMKEKLDSSRNSYWLNYDREFDLKNYEKEF